MCISKIIDLFKKNKTETNTTKEENKKEEVMTKATRVSENGIKFIKKWEGLRLNSYLDTSGVWTIGYGTIRIDGTPVTKGMTITESQANDYLKINIKNISEKAINQNVKVELNQNQYDALASFVYNLGEANLIKSTLLRKLNDGDYDSVPSELKKWKYSGGKINQGLINRRADEGKLWMTPV